MKIFLTHAYYLNEDKNELRIMKPYVPLGILYISSYLKHNGFEVELFDSTFKSFEEQKKVLEESRPEIIGIYCNLMTKLNVLPLMKFIRSNPVLGHSKIVLGGPEPPFYSEEFIAAGADIIVVGEGELTMKELCEELGKVDPDLGSVDGIMFKNKNGNLVKTNPRDMVKDVDELSLPDRGSIDLGLYLNAWKGAHGYSSISINTMRGCPYTCRWCSHSVYGLTYRRRSPQKTLAEIKYIIGKYKPDMLWFVDDVFTISHKWLNELHKLLKEQNINIRFECISRSDRLNEKVIKTLKSMGCFRLWIGAESGSQRVLDLMDRRVNALQVRETIQLTRKHGIEAGTFIMLGYPGEQRTDIHETVEHLKLSNPDIFLTTVAYPIKGTPFYDEVEERLITNLPWEKRTDRDLDFAGRYSKRFYKHANRYLVNEVNYQRMRTNRKANFLELGKTFLKAKVSKLMMNILN
jgi:radical SAM superfamily enzyme YgiQ (UPF0313 family)